MVCEAVEEGAGEPFRAKDVARPLPSAQVSTAIVTISVVGNQSGHEHRICGLGEAALARIGQAVDSE